MYRICIICLATTCSAFYFCFFVAQLNFCTPVRVDISISTCLLTKKGRKSMGSHDHDRFLLAGRAILYSNGVDHLHLGHPHVRAPPLFLAEANKHQDVNANPNSDALLLLPSKEYPDQPPFPPRNLPFPNPNSPHHNPPLPTLLPLYLHSPNLVNNRSPPRHSPFLSHTTLVLPTLPILPRQRLSPVPSSKLSFLRHEKNDGEGERWVQEEVRERE